MPPYPPPVSGLDGDQPGAVIAAAGAEAAATAGSTATPALAAARGDARATDVALSLGAAKAEIAASLAGLLKGGLALQADDMPVGSIAASPGAPTGPASSPLPAAPSPAQAPVSAGVSPATDIWRATFAKDNAGPLFRQLGKAERQGLADYYEQRGFQPLWYVDGAPTVAARAVLERIAHAAEDGLDPDDYAAAAPASSGRQDMADAEWRLSAGALAYARAARGGRINPTRLSNLVTPDLALPDARTVLDTLTAAPDAGTALGDFNPRGEGYLNLRAALATLRAEAGASQAGDAADKLASVAPADVKGGRRGSAVEQATKRAIAGAPARQLEAQIIANMERWRWLPSDSGSRYILVNVPEFALRYIDDGAVAWETRTIVGKPDTPTPIFSGEMTYLVVNPSWYIPPSIIKKEFLPKLAYDPLYAERQGYVVVNDGGHISIRQPPGAKNALGRIKFIFPNRHSVYLHDTPSRGLFTRAERAFSHGCVRVEDPFLLAQYVLNDARLGRRSASRRWSAAMSAPSSSQPSSRCTSLISRSPRMPTARFTASPISPLRRAPEELLARR